MVLRLRQHNIGYTADDIAVFSTEFLCVTLVACRTRVTHKIFTTEQLRSSNGQTHGLYGSSVRWVIWVVGHFA